MGGGYATQESSEPARNKKCLHKVYVVKSCQKQYNMKMDTLHTYFPTLERKMTTKRKQLNTSKRCEHGVFLRARQNGSTNHQVTTHRLPDYATC